MEGLMADDCKDEDLNEAQRAVQIEDMRTARDAVCAALHALKIPEGAEAYWDRAVMRGLMNVAAGVWTDLFERVGMDTAVEEFDQDVGILYEAIAGLSGVALMPEDQKPKGAFTRADLHCARCRRKSNLVDICFCERCRKVLKKKKMVR